MSEYDPLPTLLREWKSPEPEAEFDGRVVNAYRAMRLSARRRAPMWRQLWNLKISIPLPVLVTGAAVIALFFWLHSGAAQQDTHTSPLGVVTRLDTAGFEPLPNGDARIIPIGTQLRSGSGNDAPR